MADSISGEWVLVEDLEHDGVPPTTTPVITQPINIDSTRAASTSSSPSASPSPTATSPPQQQQQQQEAEGGTRDSTTANWVLLRPSSRRISTSPRSQQQLAAKMELAAQIAAENSIMAQPPTTTTTTAPTTTTTAEPEPSEQAAAPGASHELDYSDDDDDDALACVVDADGPVTLAVVEQQAADAERRTRSWLGRLSSALIPEETLRTMSQVNMLFGIFFHDIEEAKMDVIMGLLLLSSSYKVPDFSSGMSESSMAAVREAYHYWGFAACAYGWMLLNALFFTDKDTSILHGLVVGDDKNLTVLCDHCSIKPEDVIDVCWTSSDYNPGHYLAIDHATEAVVVAIRGTFHVKDALTDLVAHSAPIFKNRPYPMAHAGILKCAKRKIRLLRTKILETLEKHPNYKLVLTGHSLGAGTASLMAVILKAEFPDMDLHCHAFAPPCVLALEHSLECKNFITSYIYEFDVVPRLSWGSMTRLKQLTKRAIGQTQSSSNSARLFTALAKNGYINSEQNRLTSWLQLQRLDLSIEYEAGVMEELLLPPGKVYHLLRSPEDSKICRMELTSASFFGDIQVCVRMFTDHMPNEYELAFRGVLQYQANARKERGKFKPAPYIPPGGTLSEVLELQAAVAAVSDASTIDTPSNTTNIEASVSQPVLPSDFQMMLPDQSASAIGEATTAAGQPPQ